MIVTTRCSCLPILTLAHPPLKTASSGKPTPLGPTPACSQSIRTLQVSRPSAWGRIAHQCALPHIIIQPRGAVVVPCISSGERGPHPAVPVEGPVHARIVKYTSARNEAPQSSGIGYSLEALITFYHLP
jgi:hypothetical protein